MSKTTETLTDDMIRKLRSEAAAAVDPYTVADCDKALAGNKAARRRVATVITSARGLNDDGAFVRVVA